jgi:hypothetical protein
MYRTPMVRDEIPLIAKDQKPMLCSPFCARQGRDSTLAPVAEEMAPGVTTGADRASPTGVVGVTKWMAGVAKGVAIGVVPMQENYNQTLPRKAIERKEPKSGGMKGRGVRFTIRQTMAFPGVFYPFLSVR